MPRIAANVCCQTYFILECDQGFLQFEIRDHLRNIHYKKCRIEFETLFFKHLKLQMGLSVNNKQKSTS